MSIFRTIFPSCRQVSQMQSEALDRSVPPLARIKMRLHLLVCSWCRRYGKQIRFLRHAAHEHPEHLQATSNACLSSDAKARLKKALQDNAK